MSFGYDYDFSVRRAAAGTEIPEEILRPLRTRVATWLRVPPDTIRHALVAEYRPGTALGWHRDVARFRGGSAESRSPPPRAAVSGRFADEKWMCYRSSSLRAPRTCCAATRAGVGSTASRPPARCVTPSRFARLNNPVYSRLPGLFFRVMAVLGLVFACGGGRAEPRRGDHPRGAPAVFATLDYRQTVLIAAPRRTAATSASSSTARRGARSATSSPSTNRRRRSPTRCITAGRSPLPNPGGVGARRQLTRHGRGTAHRTFPSAPIRSTMSSRPRPTRRAISWGTWAGGRATRSRRPRPVDGDGRGPHRHHLPQGHRWAVGGAAPAVAAHPRRPAARKTDSRSCADRLTPAP